MAANRKVPGPMSNGARSRHCCHRENLAPTEDVLRRPIGTFWKASSESCAPGCAGKTCPSGIPVRQLVGGG